MKRILFLLVLALLVVGGCAVRRPLTSPHRSVTDDHRNARTIADCLDCHRDDMPHRPDRGDCFKCHRLELGR